MPGPIAPIAGPSFDDNLKFVDFGSYSVSVLNKRQEEYSENVKTMQTKMRGAGLFPLLLGITI